MLGALSVITGGLLMMPLWPADNLDSLPLVSLSLFVYHQNKWTTLFLLTFGTSSYLIPYSGKLSRGKTFRWWISRVESHHESFLHEILGVLYPPMIGLAFHASFLREMLISYWFTKVFSLKSFPPYGIPSIESLKLVSIFSNGNYM